MSNSQTNIEEKIEKAVEALQKNPQIYNKFRDDPDGTLKKVGIEGLTREQVEFLHQAAAPLTSEQLEQWVGSLIEPKKGEKIASAVQKDHSLVKKFQTNPKKALEEMGVKLEERQVKFLRQMVGNLTYEELLECLSNPIGEDKVEKVVNALKKDPSLYKKFKANPEETLKQIGVTITKTQTKLLREAADSITSEQLQERISSSS